MSDHQTKANVNSKDAVAAAAVWRSPEIIKALTSTVTTCFVLIVFLNRFNGELASQLSFGLRIPLILKEIAFVLSTALKNKLGFRPLLL